MQQKTLVGRVRCLVSLIVVGGIAAVISLNPSAARAQFGGAGTAMPSMPSMGGMGGMSSAAGRQLANPVVSPYLNLLQPGLDPAITYQTMIRPDFQIRAALVQQGQMIQNLDQQTATGATSGQVSRTGQPTTQALATQFRTTGHATTFLNTSTYYPGLQRAALQRRR